MSQDASKKDFTCVFCILYFFDKLILLGMVYGVPRVGLGTNKPF